MRTKEDFDSWLSEKVNEAIPTPLDSDLTIDQLRDLVYSYLKLQFDNKFDIDFGPWGRGSHYIMLFVK